jgi:hypothetical protein
MWRPWLRLLELLGRFRLRGTAIGRQRGFRVGDPQALDARGSQSWRGYLRSERLFDVWGPHSDGPWAPYHCVPLFAALDTLDADQVGPTPLTASEAEPQPAPPSTWLPPGARPALQEPPRPRLPAHARPGAAAPAWLTGETWTILDLQGPRAVEAAVWLLGAAGCQPVCTFDNWPHPKGVLRVEDTLAELLRWASTMTELRGRMQPIDPPLWICDSERLGTRVGTPGEFDNRYYLDDSILPGPELLRRNAIRRVVYLTLDATDAPLLDLEEYFTSLLKAGFDVQCLDLAEPAPEPRPFAAPRTPPRVSGSGYRRSAAGGFGTEVPQPSSGGGG